MGSQWDQEIQARAYTSVQHSAIDHTCIYSIFLPFFCIYKDILIPLHNKLYLLVMTSDLCAWDLSVKLATLVCYNYGLL